jgi:antitoxin component YwqK of YwqJK toxin-antitoxin module
MSNKRRPEIIRVDNEDLKFERVGTYIGDDMSYKGKPFTGFEIYGYHQNGNIAGELEYVDGERMGWAIQYYDNGNVERESLDYGATTVYFNEFDQDGNKIIGGFLEKELLHKVCSITGENPDNIKE